MIKSLHDIINHNQPIFSFEFFPPKTEDGYQNLLEKIKEFAVLKPDFISCTYGAGGGSRDKTADIVAHIQNTYNIPALHHFTCVLHTKDEIKSILENLKSRNINNILALRGDPPHDQPNWKPSANNFKYSSELCAFIRDFYGKYSCIGVAGFPEGHAMAESRDKDAVYLKKKIDAGADFIITQLFFDNEDYFSYVKRLRALGVTNKIIPGVIPITNYESLLKFCGMCGAIVTDEVHAIFKPIANNQEKTLQAGIDFCIKQCRELLNQGAPGIHFYTLNKLEPTTTILNTLRSDLA